MSNEPTAKELRLAKRRMAMRIAEDLQSEFDLQMWNQWDLDKARESIACMILDSYALVEAEMKEMDDEEESPIPKGPSLIGRLRKALGYQDGDSIRFVMEAAIQAAEDLRGLRYPGVNFDA